MSYRQIVKIEVEMTNYRDSIVFQRTFQNISAANVRWLQYTTMSSDHKTLSLAINELGNPGVKPFKDSSNTAYFISLPIDPGFPVTCAYSNQNATSLDQEYLTPISVNQLNIEAYIDGRQAVSDVTEDNPIIFEIAFYEKVD